MLVEWAGLGYYARARNLHACARAVVEQHVGVFPTTAAGLLALPGIGPYTAAAIAAIADDERIAVVDGNVDRVLARYLALDVPVREAKDEIRAAVQQAVPVRAGDFAQALMDLGATICAPKAALCMLCPLQPCCLGTRTGEPLTYPVKVAKADRPNRYGHAFVMRDAAGDVLLAKRAGNRPPGADDRGTDLPLERRCGSAGVPLCRRLAPPRADRPRLHAFPAGTGRVVRRHHRPRRASPGAGGPRPANSMPKRCRRLFRKVLAMALR